MGELHAQRRLRVAALLAEADVDAALISGAVNLRYLSGLVSSNAALLLRADGSATLATDGRYALAAGEHAGDLPLTLNKDTLGALTALAAGDGVRRLGVEPRHITLADLGRVRQALAPSPSVEVVELGPFVEQARAVKDDTEIAAIRAAAIITAEGVEAALDGPVLGCTEIEIAQRVERELMVRGAERLGFPTIVVSGPRGAIPHGEPSRRIIGSGELLTIDCGAVVAGYHADMTRTVSVGAAPPDWAQDLYELVRGAQEHGLSGLRLGQTANEVDVLTRTPIDDAGYGPNFVHGTGHGVGLEIHEAPMFGYRTPGTLVGRMTATIEPGVYLPGQGGARIEDTFLIDERGDVTVLTRMTKELIVVDAL